MTMLLALARGALGLVLNPAAYVVVALAYGYGHWQGASRAETRCEAGALRAELAIRNADLAIAERAAADAARRTESLEAEIAANREKLDDYEKSLSGAACPLGDDGARRLRDILGATRR